MDFIKMTQDELEVFIQKAAHLEQTAPALGELKYNTKKTIVQDQVRGIRYCLNLRTEEDRLPDIIYIVKSEKESDMFKGLKTRYKRLKSSLENLKDQIVK